MAVLTPGTTTGYDIQKWQRTVEGATYQKTVAIKIFDPADRPYDQLTIRKHARVDSTVLAQNAEGTGLTASTLAGTPVTLTPAGNYVAVYWSANEESQIDFSLDSEAPGEMEQALAESSDESVLANVTSFTQFISQAEIDGPMLRRGMGRLAGNTNGVAMPGGDKTVYGIFSHTQLPALGTIPEYNQAEIRGDDETPYVKGIWMKGGGLMANITTVITQDGNGWHNFIGLSSAIAVAWNTRSRVEHQKDELQHRVILFNNFGSAIRHDLRGLALRTTASAL